MLGNFLVDFLPILYQKVKNYFGLSIRHPLATIDVIQLNVPALKSQFENLFWTLFYNPDHCAGVRYTQARNTMVTSLIHYVSILMDWVVELNKLPFLMTFSTVLMLIQWVVGFKNIQKCADVKYGCFSMLLLECSLQFIPIFNILNCKKNSDQKSS